MQDYALLFNLTVKVQGRYLCCNFTDNEAEVQRGHVLVAYTTYIS